MTSITDISEIKLMLGLSGTATEEELAIAAQCQRYAEGAVRRYLQYDPTQQSRVEYYPNHDLTQDRRGIYEATDNQAYVRFVTGAATEELQVRHIPIRSITTVKVDYDGRAGTQAGSFATTWAEGSDYWANFDIKSDGSGNKFCTDGIIRSEGRWPTRPGSVELTYVAGYTQEELNGQDSVIDAGPISEAVIDEAVRRFVKVYSRKKKRLAGFAGPLSRESMGKYSYSVDTAARLQLIGGGDLSAENEHKLSNFVNQGWALAS